MGPNRAGTYIGHDGLGRVPVLGAYSSLHGSWILCIKLAHTNNNQSSADSILCTKCQKYVKYALLLKTRRSRCRCRTFCHATATCPQALTRCHHLRCASVSGLSGFVKFMGFHFLLDINHIKSYFIHASANAAFHDKVPCCYSSYLSIVKLDTYSLELKATKKLEKL
jgi:hypothetical protein